MPQQEVHQYGPADEDFYMEVPSGTAAARPDGWAFPALFKTAGGKWVLLTESALDDTYCGAHLAQNAPDGVYRIKFPDPTEGLSVGKAEPESTLPWTMPWRVMIVGDAAGRILEADLVLDLAPASRIATTNWIKPGRAAWSWWSKSDSPTHAEDLNACTDLAAEMGWEYVLVDANWDRMLTDRIEDVIAHAKAKNVGLLFWYNSGGPHNDGATRSDVHARHPPEGVRAAQGVGRQGRESGLLAQLSKLDYLLITHYHNDHVGNAAAIAAKIPVGTFIDHGPTVETTDAATALYNGDLKGRESGRHMLAKPGDKVPIRDLDVTIVAASGERITRPLSGPSAPNPLCGAFKPKDPDPTENARSIGSMIAFGRFRMVDLGDLT